MSLSGVPALALGVPDNGKVREKTESQKTNDGTHADCVSRDGTMVSCPKVEKKEEVKTRLADKKLENCKKRETKINNIMSRIADRGQKQLDLFTKISDRTQKFYTEKGKVLSNYDDLVADVNAKKAAAQTAVDTIKSTIVTFKCDGTDPKGAAQSFKAAQRSEIEALKAYKTSVKHLIVGVKSVQGTTSSTENKTEGTHL